MGPVVKIPVWGTIALALGEAIRVLRRHPYAFILCTIALVAAGLANSFPRLIAAYVLQAVLIGSLAVLVHAEVLRGPTTIEAAAFAGNRWRIPKYVLTLVGVGFSYVPFMLLGQMLLAPLAFMIAGMLTPITPELAQAVAQAANLIALLLWLPLAYRLGLNLSAVAVDERASWETVWWLGEKNSLRLAVVGALPAVAIAAVAFGIGFLLLSASGAPAATAGAAAPPAVGPVLSARPLAASAVQTIALLLVVTVEAALIAIAYGRLTTNGRLAVVRKWTETN